MINSKKLQDKRSKYSKISRIKIEVIVLFVKINFQIKIIIIN
ncbi:hypothetical protein EV143_104122 [Flavobacterium chryseum]|nr:hypothetical protein EV143_104122 [Flavobacterium sp. P3160]